MTNSTRTRVLGLTGALVTALATLTIANAPAQAAGCTATGGQSCLRLINNTQQIRSVRESKTNRCLLGITPGQTREYSNIHFNANDQPQLRGFTGSNCEGNTAFNGWRGNGWGPDSGNYFTVALRNA